MGGRGASTQRSEARAMQASSIQDQGGSTPGGVESLHGKYLSITSFKRDGTGVATPVWFVVDDGRLLVETGAASHKVRRIHRDPSVRIAMCSARGRLRGVPVRARAEVLPDSEIPRLEQLIAQKYRADMIVIRPIRAIQSAFHRGPRAKSVALAITPI
jgi:PPOX class probable F420-dependent enzyme